MPTFLSDPPTSVYLLLSAVLLVAGFIWSSQRSRKSLIAFACVLGVVALVVLLDRLFESPREEAVRRVQAMMKAADARDPDAFLRNVAPSIEYQGEGQARVVSREDLRRAPFWQTLRDLNVHVAAWDFAREDVEEIDPDHIEIGFLAKGEADGKQAGMYFRARFSRQPDGQLKLSALSSYDMIKRTNERKSIPFFP